MGLPCQRLHLNLLLTVNIAEQVVAAAEVDDLAAKLEVAGPGFINVHLKPEFLSQAL